MEGTLFDEILKVELRDSTMYPGFYVSRCGRFVRNQNHTKNPVTKVHGRTKKFIYLQSSGQWLHRLVAAAHVHNPYPGVFDTVDHIDSDKQNNCAENLRWCSKRLNCIHRKRKRYYERVRTRGGRIYYISKIKSAGETTKKYSSTKEEAILITKKLIDETFKKIYFESLQDVPPGLLRRPNMFLWTDAFTSTPGRSVTNHSGNEWFSENRRPIYSL